jgi:hypothetical protein
MNMGLSLMKNIGFKVDRFPWVAPMGIYVRPLRGREGMVDGVYLSRGSTCGYSGSTTSWSEGNGGWGLPFQRFHLWLFGFDHFAVKDKMDDDVFCSRGFTCGYSGSTTSWSGIKWPMSFAVPWVAPVAIRV